MKLLYSPSKESESQEVEVPLRFPSLDLRRELRSNDRWLKQQVADLMEEYQDVEVVAKLSAELQAQQLTPELMRRNAEEQEKVSDVQEQYMLRTAKSIVAVRYIQDAELKEFVESPIDSPFWLSQDPVALGEYVGNFRKATRI